MESEKPGSPYSPFVGLLFNFEGMKPKNPTAIDKMARLKM